MPGGLAGPAEELKLDLRVDFASGPCLSGHVWMALSGAPVSPSPPPSLCVTTSLSLGFFNYKTKVIDKKKHVYLTFSWCSQNLHHLENVM